MRVLLVGSGGREHALAACLSASPLLEALFIAPGNPGISPLGTLVPLPVDDVAALVAFAKAQKIDLVIPGPEAPLVKGLTDLCESEGILCAGPSRAAAALEGSKSFTKEIADAAGIPSAAWRRFDEAESAINYVHQCGAPIVVKADGLAAGKGVVVAETISQAENAIRHMLEDGEFGDAGKSIVIEECLFGKEVSLFALCSDHQAVLIGAARDHKRIGEQDTGPNTGGMGAISPPPDFDRPAQEEALNLFVRPMLQEMARRGTPFRGVIFAGLMLTQTGPKLIEYNVRFGDPEAQTLLMRLRSDLLPAMKGLASGRLSDTALTFSDDISISVVLAARGYPGSYRKGRLISGIERAQSRPNVAVFHAGTKMQADNLVSGGGRVLTVCATGRTREDARQRAYAAIDDIDWEDKVFRNDIGL